MTQRRLKEIRATTFVGMAIEQASGKISSEPVHDDEEDDAVAAWAIPDWAVPVRAVSVWPIPA